MPNGLPWLHLVPAKHPGQLHSYRPGGYICNFYPVAASCASIKRAPQNPVFILCPRAEGRIVVNKLHGMTSRGRWQAPNSLFPFDSSLDCKVFSKVTGVGGGLPDTTTDVGVSGNSSGLGIPSVFLGVYTQSETLETSNTLELIPRGREVQTAMPVHTIVGNCPIALYCQMIDITLEFTFRRTGGSTGPGPVKNTSRKSRILQTSHILISKTLMNKHLVETRGKQVKGAQMRTTALPAMVWEILVELVERDWADTALSFLS